MKVRDLGNRVFQIYIYTILIGTLCSSIGIGLYNLNISIFIAALFYGAIITGILSLPNIIILYLGIKWIYEYSRDKRQRNQYFFYLWMILFLLPLSIFIVSFIGSTSLHRIQLSNFLNINSFLPIPYIIAALYYIFKINDKYDKTYPINYNEDDLLADILDADLD